MRLRLIVLTVATALAVPFLAACGSSADGRTTAGSGPDDPASTTTTAAAPVPTSSAPVPQGPVLSGSSYSIVLPAGSVIDTDDNFPWSHSFHRTKDALYDIDGIILEDSCDCRAIGDATGLSRLAHQAIRSQKVTNTEVRRVADVTLAGQRFAHVTSYHAAPPGSGHAYDTYVDEYETYYAGRTLDIKVTLMGTKTRHAELETLLAQSLATLRLT